MYDGVIAVAICIAKVTKHLGRADRNKEKSSNLLLEASLGEASERAPFHQYVRFISAYGQAWNVLKC